MERTLNIDASLDRHAPKIHKESSLGIKTFVSSNIKVQNFHPVFVSELETAVVTPRTDENEIRIVSPLKPDFKLIDPKDLQAQEPEASPLAPVNSVDASAKKSIRADHSEIDHTKKEIVSESKDILVIEVQDFLPREQNFPELSVEAELGMAEIRIFDPRSEHSDVSSEKYPRYPSMEPANLHPEIESSIDDSKFGSKLDAEEIRSFHKESHSRSTVSKPDDAVDPARIDDTVDPARIDEPAEPRVQPVEVLRMPQDRDRGNDDSDSTPNRRSEAVVWKQNSEGVTRIAHPVPEIHRRVASKSPNNVEVVRESMPLEPNVAPILAIEESRQNVPGVVRTVAKIQPSAPVPLSRPKPEVRSSTVLASQSNDSATPILREEPEARGGERRLFAPVVSNQLAIGLVDPVKVGQAPVPSLQPLVDRPVPIAKEPASEATSPAHMTGLATRSERRDKIQLAEPSPRQQVMAETTGDPFRVSHDAEDATDPFPHVHGSPVAQRGDQFVPIGSRPTPVAAQLNSGQGMDVPETGESVSVQVDAVSDQLEIRFHTEKRDTIELLSRHLYQLETELRRSGIDSFNISFSDNRDRDGRALGAFLQKDVAVATKDDVTGDPIVKRFQSDSILDRLV